MVERRLMPVAWWRAARTAVRESAADARLIVLSSIPLLCAGRAGWSAQLAGMLVVACAAPAGPAAKPAPEAPRAEAARVEAPAATAPREALRVAYPAAVSSHAYLAAAQEGGYYAAEGLDVDLRLILGAPTLVTALVAGEIDMGSVAGAPAIAADLQGADLIAIGHPINRFTNVLFSRPEIRTPADLRGKIVGVVAPGSATEIAARHALRYLGVDPDREVTFTRSGDSANTFAAMTSGAVDAGVLSAPVTVQARRSGLVEHLDLSQLDVEYPSGGLVVSQRLVAEREATLLRFLRAVGRAVHRMKTDKELAFRVLGQFSQVDDPEQLEDAYRTAISLLRQVPTPTRAGIEALMEEVAFTQPAVRDAGPSQFYTPRLVQQLEAEGFYRQLEAR